MRLIDADKLICDLPSKRNENGTINREGANTIMLYEVKDMIVNAPTAYEPKIRLNQSDHDEILLHIIVYSKLIDKACNTLLVDNSSQSEVSRLSNILSLNKSIYKQTNLIVLKRDQERKKSK